MNYSSKAAHILQLFITVYFHTKALNLIDSYSTKRQKAMFFNTFCKLTEEQ